MHFAVFSKSWPPSPLSGLPFAAKTHILPLAPISCHPGEVGLWPTDQLQCPGCHFTSQSFWKLQACQSQPCQFPTRVGSPSIKTGNIPIDPSGPVPRCSPQDVDAVLVHPSPPHPPALPQARTGLPDSAPTGPEPTAHLSCEGSRRRQAVPTQFYVPPPGWHLSLPALALSLGSFYRLLLPFLWTVTFNPFPTPAGRGCKVSFVKEKQLHLFTFVRVCPGGMLGKEVLGGSQLAMWAIGGWSHKDSAGQ